jgi:hypothetical protein
MSFVYPNMFRLESAKISTEHLIDLKPLLTIYDTNYSLVFGC